MPLRSRLDRWLYPSFGDRWDIVRFREEALKLIRPGMVVLDLGAGRSALTELNFQGLGAEIWGADIDPLGETNPNWAAPSSPPSTTWTAFRTTRSIWSSVAACSNTWPSRRR